MPFNPQQIHPVDLKPNTAVGVDIPFNGSAVFKSNYLTKDAIKNNLINFFLTNPGERYLNPIFGGGLRAFIFEQIENNTLDFLMSDIQNKIKLYFPSVKVESLDLYKEEDNNAIKIELKYSILNTNINDNIEIEFN
jgi:phage baseplate assembly protein W